MLVAGCLSGLPLVFFFDDLTVAAWALDEAGFPFDISLFSRLETSYLLMKRSKSWTPGLSSFNISLRRSSSVQE